MSSRKRTEEYRLKHNAYMRAYRSRLSPEAKAKYDEMHRGYTKKWAKANPATCAANAARHRKALRASVIAKYGGECVCCAENELEFLTIDHITPIKMAYRNGRQGWFRLYLQLKRDPVDPGLQVLCFNCNHAKGTKAECPHKRLYMKRSEMFRLLSGGRTA